MANPLTVKPTKVERPPNSLDVHIEFTPTSGETLTLSLTPIAQSQLLIMLLANAKGRIVEGHFQLTRPPIRADGFAPFLLSDELAGLEIPVNGGAGALHLCFDINALRQLLAAANELASPRKGAPSAEPKH